MPLHVYEKLAERSRWLTGICVVLALVALWPLSKWFESLDLGPEVAGGVGVALTVGLIQGGSWLRFEIHHRLCTQAVAAYRRSGRW
jgi:hypothetical protein